MNRLRRVRRAAPPSASEPPRRTLGFTGTCGESEFVAATGAVESWYHSFYFDNGFEVRGNYDIGRDIASYGFPDDLSSFRVLDIGAASGWFAFYFEQLGADVTTLELRSIDEFDMFGRFAAGSRQQAADEWMESFTIMSGLLSSSVKRVRGTVYETSPELFGGQEFDLVFMGALLMHLRDPIGALMAARSVCRQRLVATNWYIPAHGADGEILEHVPADGHPTADLPALNDRTPGRYSWWRPNRSAYDLWLRAAGFRTVDVSRTLTLTADVVRAEDHNSTMTLMLADARV